MEFPNVKLLGYAHSNNFWGDKNFRYGSTISLTINGYILDLSNGSGVENIIKESETLSKSLGVSQEIEINGNSYGEGKITNISFDSGNWTRLTEYTATIEFLKDGYFDDSFNGDAFDSVISSVKVNAKYLEDFSDDFSLNYDSNGNFLNGDQSIRIKFSNLFKGDRITAAKTLAQDLLSNSKARNLVHESFSDPSKNLKEYFSETYNLVDGSCSFKRTFSHPNNGECYSEKMSTSFDVNEDGIVTVTESNIIKGECGTSEALYLGALSRFNSEIGGAYSRCNAIFNKYKSSSGIEIVAALIDKKTNFTVKKNKFSGTIEYSVSFNNDPANAEDCKTEKILEISRGEDFIWNVSVKGSFIGVGKVGIHGSPPLKIDSAFACYSDYVSAAESDAESFYRDNADPVSTGSILQMISKNFTSSVYQGRVEFTFSFSDDPRLDMSSEVRKKTLKVGEDFAVKVHNDFLIPGGSSAYAVAQLANQSTQGINRVEGSFECAVSTLPFCGFNFYEEAKNLANSNRGSSLYLDSFSFSSDEIEQTVNFSAEYKYSGPSTV